jgi:hypothetical protein
MQLNSGDPFILQSAGRKGGGALVTVTDVEPADRLSHWLEGYFRFEATTAESSRQVQRRGLETFILFVVREGGGENRPLWAPRLSRAFVDWLRVELTPEGKRRYSDRTINRMLAHLKTFASWVQASAVSARPSDRQAAGPADHHAPDRRAGDDTAGAPAPARCNHAALGGICSGSASALGGVSSAMASSCM